MLIDCKKHAANTNTVRTKCIAFGVKLFGREVKVKVTLKQWYSFAYPQIYFLLVTMFRVSYSKNTSNTLVIT